MLIVKFDPAHRYSRGDPIDLVGGGGAPFTHGAAGAAGGAIEPFPFTDPSSPQNMSQGLSHEGYAGPGSSSAHGPDGGYTPRMSYGDYGQMAMPDARNYAPGGAGAGGGGGWSGYGGDGYATAAGMGAAGAAAGAGAAGIGAFNNRNQAQAQHGYSGYDYRSESTSQSGDSAYPPSSGGGHGFGGAGMGMTALTPAAIAKQREATGGGRHAQQPSWGSQPGASGSGAPYGYSSGQGPSSPTAQTQDERRQSGPYSDDQQHGDRQSGVFVHRDMDDVPEHALGDELPPQYVFCTGSVQSTYLWSQARGGRESCLQARYNPNRASCS